jgi:pimeloyl-ACP methyl ester carboxylesterase
VAAAPAGQTAGRRHGRCFVRSAVHATAGSQIRRLRLWQDQVETEVEIAGSGPPLVYLHGPWGIAADRPFLAQLARTHTVYAPRYPGTTPGASEAVHALDTWLDLIVYHGELLDRLELDAPAFVGHSFGGMLAAEFAAAIPKSVRRLVLLDPVGLWRDDLPVKNWMLLHESERRQCLFADQDGAAAQRFFGLPPDPEQRVETLAQSIWAQACTGKFVWPLPDRGLRRRMHRIVAPTLIVWGKADRIIDAAYAQEFAKHIRAVQVELIEGAGHLPHLEQSAAVARVVSEFLD